MNKDLQSELLMYVEYFYDDINSQEYKVLQDILSGNFYRAQKKIFKQNMKQRKRRTKDIMQMLKDLKSSKRSTFYWPVKKSR